MQLHRLCCLWLGVDTQSKLERGLPSQRYTRRCDSNVGNEQRSHGI